MFLGLQKKPKPEKCYFWAPSISVALKITSHHIHCGCSAFDHKFIIWLQPVSLEMLHLQLELRNYFMDN